MIVKFTKVTLEHRSGVNLALLFLVIIYIENWALKSISWSPTLIKVIPPVLYIYLFKTEFNIGSTFYTSWTIKGLPNLIDFYKFFRKASSAKEDKINDFSAKSDVRYSMACPEGSIMRGYLWYFFMMIAFSVHRSSDGSLWDFQTKR